VTLRDPVTVQLARLQDENADLRARIRDLEALLKPTLRFPLAWRLTVQQTQIMSLLVSREFVAHETARCVVLDKESIKTPQKQLLVQITHIRKKLSAFGIGIHTVWGQGYLIEPKTKQRIFREIEAAASEANCLFRPRRKSPKAPISLVAATWRRQTDDS
jgi:DNA-binding winged helix-turn-helix (wHTH) protein